MAIAEKTSAANRRLTRRREPRHMIKIECRRGALGFGPNLAAQFLDLSEGGIRIVLKTDLACKQEVEVRLSGPHLARTIMRIADVVWSLPLEDGRCCVGLSFQKRLSYGEVQTLARP
jgi:hypothetical protein